MPYVSDKIRLTEKQDRRVKLLSEDKEEIRKLYATGQYSMGQLAKQYNVCKKTILLIVNPESKKKNDQYIKENWKKFRLPTEKRTEYRNNTARYKYELYKSGQLDENVLGIKKFGSNE